MDARRSARRAYGAKLYRDPDVGPVGTARMYGLSSEQKRVLTASAESYVHERFSAPLRVRVVDLRCDAARYDYGLSRCNEYRRRLSTSWNEAAATTQ